MSSLAAARADNFYYPPDWTPDKDRGDEGSHTHPLGERAKNAHLGIITIRFELPYNCWCLHCKNFVSKGVRYNAEKKQCGSYFSTKLWEFTMLCHRCKGVIKIQTDPQNRDYKFICGLQPKVETFDNKDAGTQKLLDDEEKARAAKDPMYRLEVMPEPEEKQAKRTKKSLGSLCSIAERGKDDYAWSQKLRAAFRAQKKELKKSLDESAKKGFGFHLLEASPADDALARQVKFAPALSADKSTALRRLAITSSSIFQSAPGTKAHRAVVAAAELKIRRGLTLKLPPPSSPLTSSSSNALVKVDDKTHHRKRKGDAVLGLQRYD